MLYLAAYMQYAVVPLPEPNARNAKTTIQIARHIYDTVLFSSNTVCIITADFFTRVLVLIPILDHFTPTKSDN